MLKAETLPGQEHLLSQLFINDDSGLFDMLQHDLAIKREVVIQFPSYLFGPSGVAASNAEIGVAVMWTSKPSNQRGIFIGDSFRLGTVERTFTVNGVFPKGTIRDRFQLTTALYLKHPGTPAHNEKHLARVPGFLLGNLGDTTIHLKGSGSIFPIFTYKEDGPLWRVECNWSDPRSDAFDDENVRIILNESHPDYRFVGSGDTGKLTPLMKEIIATALHIIIKRTKDEVPLEDIMDQTNVEEGSVCLAVRYFIETFNLDVSTDENLAYSLRTHLDRKSGG